jgi:hypothetical protein
MNWLKRLFGKKQDPKKEQKINKQNVVTGKKYVNSNSQRNSEDYLLSPLNPLSPFSIWDNNKDSNNENSTLSNSDNFNSHSNNYDSSSYDSGSNWSSSSNDSTSYDSGSSFDSSSSSSFD